MKNERILASVLCVAMGASLLTGCGPKAEQDSPTPTKAPVPSTAPTAEPSPAPEAAGEEITVDQAGAVSDKTVEKMVISSKVGEEVVTLENVTINDTLYVNGGATIHLDSCIIPHIVVLRKDVQVHLIAKNKTNVDKVTANTSVILEEKDLAKDYYGFNDLVTEDGCIPDHQAGEYQAGSGGAEQKDQHHQDR